MWRALLPTSTGMKLPTTAQYPGLHCRSGTVLTSQTRHTPKMGSACCSRWRGTSSIRSNRTISHSVSILVYDFPILVISARIFPTLVYRDSINLRGYREADLRLCIRLCRLLVNPCGGSNELMIFFVALTDWL